LRKLVLAYRKPRLRQTHWFLLLPHAADYNQLELTFINMPVSNYKSHILQKALQYISVFLIFFLPQSKLPDMKGGILFNT